LYSWGVILDIREVNPLKQPALLDIGDVVNVGVGGVWRSMAETGTRLSTFSW